ncbi:MAG TPA: DNA cytosine methyltransferase [Symbiobacteriaceae bacterium]|nr:DNA cytosine methyltransferase [Symbiobacteriaceae bacterium]
MQDRTSIRRHKLERLARGESPRVMDLFSGCGGISLGFLTAGFDIVANVEFDPHAAATHALNFHRGDPRHAVARDITHTEPEGLLEELYGTDAPDQMIDVIVGGPPCQAYTRVGRAKLRDVHQHPEAFRQDARGNLYLRYLEYVRRLQPLAIVMENVPDSLNYGGVNIPNEVAEALTELGYNCRYTLLNAVHYGVPQYRERMILIAVAEEVGQDPRFPDPENSVDLPEGYMHMRQTYLPENSQVTFFDRVYHVASPSHDGRPRRFVSAQEALEDLPFMKGRTKKSNHPYGEPVPYAEVQALSSYARLMRKWSAGFVADHLVRDHVTRAQPRDYPIFERMGWGDQYPAAHRIAEGILEDRIWALGFEKQPGALWYEDLRNRIVPPYDPGKFPNKWRKMAPNEPARTLLAHLGKDTYTHIHYDPEQARTISVREAARLQSFPDAFQFPQTLNAAYRMIGNAVPPLLALCVAKQVLATLMAGVSFGAYGSKHVEVAAKVAGL